MVTALSSLPDSEWEGWLRDWRLSLTHRTTPATVRTYLRGMGQFVAHLDATHPEIAGPEQVTRREIEEWLGLLRTSGKAPATRRRLQMTLKAFFGWVADDPSSLMEADPTQGIAAPAVELTAVQVVTDEQLRALLATCERGRTFIDVRDTAIIRTFLDSGVRRSEIAALTVPDIDLVKGMLLVHGKGEKIRVIPTSSSKTDLALARYRRVRDRVPDAASVGTFFLSATKGGRGRAVPLSSGAIAEMLRRRCRKAGIATIHPHAIRHAWADANKRAGVSDEDLERMAGWTNPLMVRRYGRALADERARAALRQAAAGDRV